MICESVCLAVHFFIHLENHHRLQSESEHQIYWKVIKSLYLQVVAIVSCLFVVVSTLCLIFSTLPAFQIKDEDGNISREFFTLVNTRG